MVLAVNKVSSFNVVLKLSSFPSSFSKSPFWSSSKDLCWEASEVLENAVNQLEVGILYSPLSCFVLI